MSTILRYAKYLRRLNSAGWRVVPNQPQIEVTGVKMGFYQTCLVHLSPTKNYATNVAAQRQLMRQYKETHMEMLETRMKRHGRVLYEDVQKALTDVQFSGTMSSLEALFLIRCCGRALNENTNEECIQLVQDIWDAILRLHVPMDVSHFNTLLSVYIEKKHKFSPSSFISTMLEKSIEPNQVTYQRLIASLCDRGDIESTTKILEIMKDKNMPLCEGIFNSLITGHSQANDLENAIKTLDTMKSMGIEPSSDTYKALMCAYAKVGDIQSIEAISKELGDSIKQLSSSQSLEVFYALVANGHTTEAEIFLDKYVSEVSSDSETGRILVKLVFEDQIPMAMKLLSKSTNTLRRAIRSSYIIRAAVKNEKITTDNLIKACTDLQMNENNDRAFPTAVLYGLKCGRDPETMISLLKAWRDRGAEIRNHYFWPLLRSCTMRNSYEGIMDIMRTMMKDFGLVPCVETLQDYVVPYVFGTWQEATVALENLSIPRETIYFAILKRLLAEKKMRNAGMFMTVYRMKYPREIFLPPLVDAFLARYNVDTFVHALRLLDRDIDSSDSNETSKELVDDALSEILASLPSSRSNILFQLLERFVEYNLSMSPETGNKIRLFLNNDLKSETDRMIENLTSKSVAQVPVSQTNPYKSASVPEPGPSMDVRELRVLFDRYLRHEDTPRILEVLDAMEVAQYTSAPVWAQALSYFCDREYLEAAEKCINKMKQLNGAKFDNVKCIKYAILLVKKGRVNDAITFISQQSDGDDNVKYSRMLKIQIHDLLNEFVKLRDVQNLSKVFNVLNSKKFMTLDSREVDPLVRIHIKMGDWEKALDAFERCCIDYRCTPCKFELIKRLIEVEDANSLQKITDLCAEIYGETNALVDLALCFFECDRPRQAQKILETSGMQLRNDRIKFIVDSLSRNNDMDKLGQLTTITRFVPRMDRSYLYDSILNVYDDKNDWEKGLGLWNEMQENDVHPTPFFLQKLRTLLERNNQKVPFIYSDVDAEKNYIQTMTKLLEKTSNVGSQRANLNPQLEEAFARRDYDMAENVITSLQISNSQKASKYWATIRNAIHNDDIDIALNLAEKTLREFKQTNRVVLKILMNEITDADRLKKFEALGELMDEREKMNVRFRKLVSIGRIKIHGLRYFLENVDITPPTANSRSIESIMHYGALVKGLRDDPTALPLMKETAQKLLAKDCDRGMHVLWCYHYMNGSPEAEHLWNMYVSKSPSPLINPIIDYAIENQNAEIIVQLNALTEQSSRMSLNVGAKLAITLIRIYNQLENYDEALNVFKKASSKFTTAMLSLKDLKELRIGLRNSSKVLPEELEKDVQKNENEERSVESNEPSTIPPLVGSSVNAI